ncbi:MAG: carboxymuconolactone decarboxylase family protein [Acholeplasmatales bacterium]|mgnify:CR=1 FL=1|jgi:AhpD family alkylhydroperoxidase|nr:carboxymuconolactone decarboxylase family protein [Acholeplasmataceae bacterium]MCK9233869.1 carboxymuconolactone decarboxylase family protein [Acholeplasmataceae bacterium]MCK9289362.1 carboxymuconolactone decarboxylase family protein [Acholeplasmataceae bacterium]MCK9428089.1 carboxymuconolactone decarboxylase family protein [Acholeplasmataceae bacterium]MDY0115054.1 carboxymuconolactone decarboxylase family protein [Acholeplasmatales bacterium]
MKKITYYDNAKTVMKLYLQIEEYFKKETTISKTLYHLIKIRASQINGCAHCLNMHTKEALKDGESTERLFLINTWSETNLFTLKEKLVLELTEQVTLIADYGMSEDLYERVLGEFSDKEYTDLILIINQINSWNRLSISHFNTVDK